jgi:HD-like signal output (HDOD) protein
MELDSAMAAWTQPLTLDQILQRGVRLPACPAVFARLMSVLGLPTGHGGEVARIISTDTALTAQVLRVANSAAYGLARRIRSVDDATFRLGFGEIWAIANAIKGRELFQNPGGAEGRLYDRLWRHSLTTAILARALGKRLNPQFSDAYFTAGILHDLAKLALYQLDPRYAAVCRNGDLSGAGLVAAEQVAYGTHHAVLGGELLRYWNIPNTIAMLVMEHHDAVPEDDRLKNVRALLANCDTLSHALTMLCGDNELTFNKAMPKDALATAKLDMNTWLSVSGECQHNLLALADV